MKATYMNPIKNELPSLGFDSDRELGRFVADAKLQATQDGYSDRYLQGMDTFWGKLGLSSKDRTIGEAIALAVLEERRRTLHQIAVRTLLFGIPGVLAALLIGVKPEQSAIAFLPAGAIALCSTKR